MAHELTNNDQMMYTGAVPWHGLGKLIPEHCTPREALDHAELNWQVKLATPEWTPADDSPDGGNRTLDDHRVVYRADTRAALGVVSSKYKPFQNSEMVDFIGQVLGEDFDAVETAGSFADGRRVWFLLKQGQHNIAGVDPVAKYSLFATGHDGKLGIRVLPTNIRVVCKNTFSMSGAEGTGGVSIPHRGDMAGAIERARRVLAGTESAHDSFIEAAERLSLEDVMSDRWLDRYFKRVYIGSIASDQARAILMAGEPSGDPDQKVWDQYDRAARKAAQTITSWKWNFEDGDGNQIHSNIRNTKWAAFNAVTRQLDHESTSRGDRMESNLLGKRADQKRSAFAAAFDTPSPDKVGYPA